MLLFSIITLPIDCVCVCVCMREAHITVDIFFRKLNAHIQAGVISDSGSSRFSSSNDEKHVWMLKLCHSNDNELILKWAFR